MNRSFVVVLFSVAVSVHAVAQVPDAAVKLRLAQSFEQAGEWERAVPIYESLFFKDPNNFVYFEALRRGYTQLKEYEKAIELLQYRLTSHPGDPILLSTLGGIYYQMGNDRKADSLWQAIIRTGSHNPNLYRLVANQMMEFRLYDRAIQTFLDARKTIGDQNLFTDELARLYGAFQQYDQATQEYIRILVSKPEQLTYVQSSMSLYLNRPEALTAARRVIGNEVAAHGESVPLRRLYAWVLMEAKDYETALKEERVIDRLTRASGRELFNFAQRAAQEQAYRTAAEAFHEVLSGSTKPDIVPYAKFGYARAMEEVIADSDSIGTDAGRQPVSSWPVSEARTGFGGVLDLYQSVIREFPGTQFAAQALYRIGMIRKDRFSDLDGALTAFRQVRKLVSANALGVEATLSMGEVLTAKNDLAGAAQEYRMLLTSGNSLVRDRARFRLAELDYFQAKFDSSEATLKILSKNPSDDLANDALQLLYFVQENKLSSPEGLKEYARGELLVRQKKFSEARAVFADVVKHYPLALLVDDATIRMGELSLNLGHPLEAIATFRSVADSMTSSILRDQAQWKIAQAYESVLKDSAKAIEAYETLLTKFPKSMYVEQARKRIRILRGDNI